ncbi:MAG TPA: hypothetical protein VMN36_01815 [Verrucomicrobiales bacterium]|nr:hypothetical protein [Verrucomicrobiales bacterium]
MKAMYAIFVVQILVFGTARAVDQDTGRSEPGAIPSFLIQVVQENDLNLHFASDEDGETRLAFRSENSKEIGGVERIPAIAVTLTLCDTEKRLKQAIDGLNNASALGVQKTLAEEGLVPIGETQNAFIVRYYNKEFIHIGFERNGFFVRVRMKYVEDPMRVAKQIDDSLEELDREGIVADLDNLFKVVPDFLPPATAAWVDVDQKYRDLKQRWEQAPEGIGKELLLQEIAALRSDESKGFLREQVLSENLEYLRRAQCLEALCAIEGDGSLDLCYRIVGTLTPSVVRDEAKKWSDYLRTVALRGIRSNEDPAVALKLFRELEENIDQEAEWIREEFPEWIEYLIGAIEHAALLER